MNKQSSRDIFDIISLNVIGFLENHIGITDVEFIERSGIAEMSLTTWEEENAPYTLPEDYKAFLQIFDGMSLSWRIKRGDQEIPLGNMHLNKLRDIKRIKGESFKLQQPGVFVRAKKFWEESLQVIAQVYKHKAGAVYVLYGAGLVTGISFASLFFVVVQRTGSDGKKSKAAAKGKGSAKKTN